MIKLDKTNKTTILFLSWRDIKAPKRGGAEVYTHEMLKRIDNSKYRIIHISPEFENSKKEEFIENIRYLRMGKNSISVIFEAEKFYRSNKENIDYVVDQCNTHRFFTKLWVPAHKRIFFIHQLTREIWHLNAKAPLSIIGYYTETLFLKLSKNDYTITVSESTKKDLLAVGFNPEKVFILPEGIDFEHWDRESFFPKEQMPTFIYVGRFVNYKGIDDTVKAFSNVKLKYPEARLWIVGKKNQQYIDDVLKSILDEKKLSYGDEKDNPDVVFFGFVSDEKKLELMSRAHALIFPSQREGWGLIITEAAAVGTPSIGYNSSGIVDAIDFGKAGYLCINNNVESIIKHMENIITDKKGYEELREKAYEFSLKFHWNNTATAFNSFMEKIKKY
ncbi:glycosyltransferase family 4 protein [Clostridium tetanomorphum]|uniref:Glycosyltransferase family 4 protein n=2 Tax=Clostridium tetanomorphum TaxID=1553 RepID=A0A923E9P6_CLOTT|nr:glycosyltransferase family 4 protein [Clostridium tetanomorphum]MBC2397004.1 glycosyltransferase family 4 protein [Clostridium tetanomorphum]